MKPSHSGELAALVLASRGGARLRRTLDSVAWIATRVVVDPRGCVARESLPADVRLVAMPPEESTAGGWVLLLTEGETATPALANAIGAVLRLPTEPVAYRVRREVLAFGATLRPRVAPLRLVREPELGVGLRAGIGVELPHARAARPTRTLAPALCMPLADSLTEMVDDLSADATALATLLHARRERAAFWHLLGPPLATAARLLVAPGSGPLLARWAIAVIAGYGALVAHATLWERAHASPARGGAEARMHPALPPRAPRERAARR